MCSMWDLSSPTRDQTLTPALEVQSVNHWTTRQVLGNLFLISMEVSMYYRATSSRLRPPIRNPVRGTVKTLTTLYDTDTNQGPCSTVKDKYVNKIQSEEDKRAINEQDTVSTSQQ